MQTEIILFWVVAAGFLITDNLVLLPTGRDYLGFGMRGRFVYSAATRLEARGRELVMLNPLNLFQRAAVTTRGLGRLSSADIRSARRQVGQALPTLNTFSWLGYAYLVCAAGLASLSFAVHFGSVLASFLATHLVFCLVSIILLVRRRKVLNLTSYQTMVFAVEAMLVPAYTINLGKRLWSKRVLDLPAMSLGIRRAKRTRDEFERELAVHQLRERIQMLESAAPDDHEEMSRGTAAVSEAREQEECVPIAAEPTHERSPSHGSHQRSERDLIREAKACLMV